MTRKQQEFYRILVNQMVDFNEDFHKEFTIKRIEAIEDEKLKYLLEDINIDQDKIGKKRGYLTYSKFIYYADKLIKSNLFLENNSTASKVDELYHKREWLLQSIAQSTKNLDERNSLIEGIKNKTLMFTKDNKNVLNECDYFIIENFGFSNFFNENKNYHIKEEIEIHFKKYLLQRQSLNYNERRLLK